MNTTVDPTSVTSASCSVVSFEPLQVREYEEGAKTKCLDWNVTHCDSGTVLTKRRAPSNYVYFHFDVEALENTLVIRLCRTGQKIWKVDVKGARYHWKEKRGKLTIWKQGLFKITLERI